MTPCYTPKLTRYVGLAGFLLLMGIFTGLSEMVVVAVPVMTSLALGLALSGEPDVDARLSCDTERCLEDEAIAFQVDLHSGTGPAATSSTRRSPTPASR